MLYLHFTINDMPYTIHVFLILLHLNKDCGIERDRLTGLITQDLRYAKDVSSHISFIHEYIIRIEKTNRLMVVNENILQYKIQQ